MICYFNCTYNYYYYEYHDYYYNNMIIILMMEYDLLSIKLDRVKAYPANCNIVADLLF